MKPGLHAVVLLAGLLGCGGFHNAPLRDRDVADGAVDLGTHPSSPAIPRPRSPSSPVS